MAQQYGRIKNIAIVAHVDHGKTTLVDGLLEQSGTMGDRYEKVERVMDSGELEREKGITITAKNCSLYWKDTKVNILDTPGHADFGGEVERAISMVDGILLLVDASEGPLPQTRFVLQKAMERDLKIAVVMNKVDRPDERITEVRREIEDLFLDLASFLGKEDHYLEFPVIYASAKHGWATNDAANPKVKTANLNAILDLFASEYYPSPRISEGEQLQLLISNLSYSSYLGRLSIGRIQRGKIKKNVQYTLLGETKPVNFKVAAVQIFQGLGTAEVDEAFAGDIVLVAGVETVKIGDTITAVDRQEPLPRIIVEPPTVSVFVSVNTSPLAGKEGEYLTSRKLEEMLARACLMNVALQYSPSDDPKVFILKGRGELQLAIVFEEIRRAGYELMAGRPQVIFQEENGQKLEPFEQVIVDLPNAFVGVITETMGKRKGKLLHMAPFSEGRTRLEFEVPSRGLIGYRSQFLTDTKGAGLMSAQFLGFKPYAGDMLGRNNGALISDRTGKTTAYALFNLLASGRQFVEVGEPVYEGEVVGEHNKTNELNVNVVREKHLTNVRTAGKDTNLLLPPIPKRTLEWALDWIDGDEWVEITPLYIRIRKKELDKTKRSVVRKLES